MAARHALKIYVDKRKNLGTKVARAFAHGSGGAIDCEPYRTNGPIGTWGITEMIEPVLTEAQQAGRDWYYLDHCYLGKRGLHFRATKNAWQHDGKGVADLDRAHRLGISLRPWQDNLGGPIMICPPGELMSRLRGWEDPQQWMLRVVNAIKEQTDRRIWIRNKPADLRRSDAFEAALDGVYCVVTHISNTAIEAVCQGIPAFVTGECAARPMCRTNLAEITDPPFHPDRRHWLGILARNQFTLDELESGHAWEIVNHG